MTEKILTATIFDTGWCLGLRKPWYDSQGVGPCYWHSGDLQHHHPTTRITNSPSFFGKSSPFSPLSLSSSSGQSSPLNIHHHIKQVRSLCVDSPPMALSLFSTSRWNFPSTVAFFITFIFVNTFTFSTHSIIPKSGWNIPFSILCLGCESQLARLTFAEQKYL